MKKVLNEVHTKLLPKSPTGIKGLDEITFGGLPKGRITLVCGSAGCGKTLLAMEFLVRGATQYDEPGVFVAFEETSDELAENVISLGFDLQKLQKQKKIFLDHVYVERSEIEETGEYDLEGLFIRIDYAIRTVGAKRVVLDTIESLFSGFSNPMILRAELRRLFRWLRKRGVTTVITGERGDNTLTRQGLEEYVSDCVIMLDHRVNEQTSTRRIRILKYRGSTHGTNEYPFLIDETGFSVLPITSLGLAHSVSSERISSGIAELDQMLGNKGYFRGSSVLVSGTAGTGKSSLAAHLTDATARTGERVLYFSLEESPPQVIRNMRSVGIDLEPWVKKGLLMFHAMRPTLSGLEMHLTTMLRHVDMFRPSVVIVDPINSFVAGNNDIDAKSLSMRLIDYLKNNLITAFFTSLTSGGEDLEKTDIFISSLIDTWILLRDIELGGERNRGIYILKSRGMAHSNQIREFMLTDHGIKLRDVYIGMEGVLTGSARVAQEAREREIKLLKQQELQFRKLEVERKRKVLEAKIASLRAEFEAEEAESLKIIGSEQARIDDLKQDEENIAENRRSARISRSINKKPNPL
ncbi:MAG: circadian clock protein KaiC [Bacteroidota bacterium]|nr:circadian clock protein KaiC [Bacteroidota bacterium]